MDDFQTFTRECQSRVEAALRRLMPDTAPPRRLHAAMRYGALGGGKRVRPMLVYAAGRAMRAAGAGRDTAKDTAIDAPACAVEMVHVYSLIHDDLPAMDDDDLRRGRPTCHKRFDEATAILAGDALQPLAYQVIAAEARLSARSRLAMIAALSVAAGSSGLVGGQVMDLQAEGKKLSAHELETIHAKKTGALIRAAVRIGALCGDGMDAGDGDNDANENGDNDALAALDEYARCIGLAFQIQDDILDEVGETAKLGKPRGSDRRRGKSTFVSVRGIDAARRRAAELLNQATAALDRVRGDTDHLAALGRYIVQRDY